MNGGYCDICGQPLTDASGRWDFAGKDRGINAIPGCVADLHIKCCAWCKDCIDEAVRKVSEKNTAERQKL